MIENPALEKFIERLGIEVYYDIDRDVMTSTGKKYICVGIRAYYKDEETYTQYHCWEITNTGHMTYEDGNEVRGVGESIFNYLGDNDEVYRYFRNKAKEYGKEYFNGTYKNPFF